MEKKIRKCLSARDFVVLAFIIMEYYVSCFSRRKSRTPLALVIKLAVEISKLSFCIRMSIFSIRLSLIERYMGQLMKKLVSSSICAKQKGHFRLCTARLLCRPFSIRRCLDNLNFDIEIGSVILCIMYFSKRAFYTNSCLYFRECLKFGGVLLNIKKS